MHIKTSKNVWTLVGLAMLTATASVSAAVNTNYWIGGSGSFTAPVNWSRGVAPVSGDFNYFTNNASYSVTNSGYNGGGLYYDASSGVVTNVLTGTVSLGAAPAYLGVGDSAGSTATVVQVGAAQMSATHIYIGNAGVGSYTVTGSGALLNSASDLNVGYTNGSAGSSLVVTNGARFTGAGVKLGVYNSGNNSIVESGASTTWTNTTTTYLGYANSAFNSLLVEDGAKYVVGWGLTIGNGANSSNNTVIVTGPGSYLEAGHGHDVNGYLTIGSASDNNTMIVSNGAAVQVYGTSAFNLTIGNSSTNNALIVTGAGSTFSNNMTTPLYVGRSTAPTRNRLVIDDGAELFTSNLNLTAGSGNTVQILRGGILDVTNMNVSAAANSVTNFGGVFQFFANAAPIITKNGSNIVLTNGTISFLGIDNADVKGNWTGSQLTNILFQGNNTFRLNSSSNTTANQNYIFDTGLGATNYVGLELVNGTTLWQSGQLTIGSGGSFLASNTVGTVAAVVTNLGKIEVYHSQMTWLSNVVISGKYVSDPSTNTYLADVTVSQSGTLAGGAGDLFDFKNSLFINSTNRIAFQLANSAVLFSGGGMHTNAVTGVDLGSDKGLAQYEAFTLQTNFAYGELHLGSATDQICFTCGNIPAIASNGLYVGWLDLLNDASLVTNLHAASGIDIYYNNDDPRNSYLNGANYQLTDCNFNVGGGFLIAIPEPSVLAMILVGALTFLARHQTRRN